MSSPTLDTQLVFFCQEQSIIKDNSTPLNKLYEKKFRLIQEIAFYEQSTNKVDPSTGFIYSKKNVVKFGNARLQKNNCPTSNKTTHISTVSANIERLREELTIINLEIFTNETVNS